MKFCKHIVRLGFSLLILLNLPPLYAQTPFPACGTSDTAFTGNLLRYTRLKDLTEVRRQADKKLEYRIGIDINYQTYLLYKGNKELIKKTALEFIDRASAVFEKEVNIKLSVASILIWDQPEPYALNEDFAYFSNIYEYWSTNRFEERDAVVSFSSRGGWFYGGYRMATSNFPDPEWPNLNVGLLCHELGHTLGSPHTHNCSWPGGPIDYCEALENTGWECETGYSEAGSLSGSIMSYCRTVISFHPLCRNLIRDYADGKAVSQFQLHAFDTKPEILKNITIISKTGTATPYLEWNFVNKADSYQIQIASDSQFQKITTEVTSRQNFIQCPDIPPGTYYARIRARNQEGDAPWTNSSAFSVSGFSAAIFPPQISDLKIQIDSTITSSFGNAEKFQRYQLELSYKYGEVLRVYEKDLGEEARPKIVLPFPFDFLFSYSARFRVQKNNQWGRWSDKIHVNNPTTLAVWPDNQIGKVSAQPVLVSHYGGYSGFSPVTQQVEVSTTPAFSNVIFRDSAHFNRPNQKVSNKALFTPVLPENTSLYARFRVISGQDSSGWRVYPFVTGMTDGRFEYLGTPSTGLQYGGFSTILKSKFYKTNNKLYVYDDSRGYFATTDLINWEVTDVRTSKAKSPDWLSMFGASADGKTYVLDPNSRLVIRESNQSGYNKAPFVSNYLLLLPPPNPIAVSNAQGLFLRSSTWGIFRYRAPQWDLYEANFLNSNTSVATEKSPDDRVWTVMDSGQVFVFNGNSWDPKGTVPFSGTVGIAFDANSNCYAYGRQGVFRLAKNENTWTTITQLWKLPVQKLVFDAGGQMWMACYDPTNFNQSTYGIAKYANDKLSLYSDGLNFSRELFDIEVFQNKLLILTHNGELHAFDENKIIRNALQSGYCPGQSLNTTLTTNSSFKADNQFSIALKNTVNNQEVILPAAKQADNTVSATLPETLAPGSYVFYLRSSNPAIISPQSEAITVRPGVNAGIETISTNQYQKLLSVAGQPGAVYQWAFNGEFIAGANQNTLSARNSGSYSVTITNSEGCVTTTPAFEVALVAPDEIMLLQNTPNPLWTESEIAWFLPFDANAAELKIFSQSGQLVRTHRIQNAKAGWSSIKVDRTALTSGTYLYQLSVGNYSKTLKMVVY